MKEGGRMIGGSLPEKDGRIIAGRIHWRLSKSVKGDSSIINTVFWLYASTFLRKVIDFRLPYNYVQVKLQALFAMEDVITEGASAEGHGSRHNTVGL